MTLPALSLAGGIDGPRLLPTYTLQADAKNGSVCAGDVTLPALTLDALLEPPLALPAPPLAATA